VIRGESNPVYGCAASRADSPRRIQVPLPYPRARNTTHEFRKSLLPICTVPGLLLGVLATILPVAVFAQCCATQAAASQPQVVFTCGGGLCENFQSPYTTACPDGSPTSLIQCGVSNYYSYLAHFFGNLSYASQTVQNGKVKTIDFIFNSQGNGRYVVTVNPVSPVACPKNRIPPHRPHKQKSAARTVQTPPANTGNRSGDVQTSVH
jgi:hypothetical protein